MNFNGCIDDDFADFVFFNHKRHGSNAKDAKTQRGQAGKATKRASAEYDENEDKKIEDKKMEPAT